jgi:Protein of unknown function (DUF4238)/SEC-C motif
MTTHRNHYVPQWYQRRFFKKPDVGLYYIDITTSQGVAAEAAQVREHKRHSPKFCFWGDDLYTTILFGTPNDDIERFLFGDIDNSGAQAALAVVENDQRKIHAMFQPFFDYMNAQKIRTPKGLDWVKSQYRGLDQMTLMYEMQALRQMNCTMWVEAVREIVSAESSDLKFIVTDHPVTIYHPGCPPDSADCQYPNDPDVSLKGSQTIFPLGSDYCLILTNLEYANDPERTDLLTSRTNARNFGKTLTRIDHWIRARKLTSDEVIAVNRILKARAHKFIAADKEDWLYPERAAPSDWKTCGKVLLPPENELWQFRGETYIGYKDGTSGYQDAFGRTSKSHEYLNKPLSAADPEPDKPCPCGSGRAFGDCCLNLNSEDRAPWGVYSIRERNLMFMRAIEKILDMDAEGKTWNDVRTVLSEDQVRRIHVAYASLWPPETNIAELLPRPDPRVFRAVYIGLVDPRTVVASVQGWLSYFDEVLLPSPFMNANNIRPEYSPIDSPGQHKEQTLKNILLLSMLLPHIYAGRVHLVPDPLDFSDFFRDSIWTIAREKRDQLKPTAADRKFLEELGKDDFKRSFARLSDESLRRQIRKSDPDISDRDLDGVLKAFRYQQRKDPLSLLQPMEPGDKKGQLIQFRTMNFELAMFLAQLIGGAIYSDQSLTKTELDQARTPTNPDDPKQPSSVEKTMIMRLSAFGTYDAQVAEIENCSGIRSRLRNLWKAASAFKGEEGAAAVSLALDQLEQAVTAMIREDGEPTAPAKRAGRELGFDIDVHIIVPANGFWRSAVQRFLVSFGRRRRMESVPLAIIFGRAVAASESDAASAH